MRDKDHILLERAYHELRVEHSEVFDIPVVIIDGNTVDMDTVDLGDLKIEDAPDFINATPKYAEFDNGVILTESELKELLRTDVFREFVIATAPDFIQ